MKNRARYLCFIIMATQMVCVAAGLWIHRRLVISMVQSEAEEKVRTELKSGADKLVSSVGEFDFTSLPPGTAQAERVRALIRSSAKSQQNIVTVVNAERRILFNEAVLEGDSMVSLSPGQVVSWTQLATSPASQANPFSATFDFPDGPHIGLAYKLTNEQGYILIHRPVANIVANSAAIARLLLAAGAIALFWIFALLALVTYMLLTRFQNMFSREYAKLQEAGTKQAHALVRTRDAVIFGLAKLTDSRDPKTGAHLERITLYSCLLTAELRRYPKYRDVVTTSFARLIKVSIALHDIGKVGIEDAILLKRGPLTDAQRARMETHTRIGGQCLKEIEECLGSSNFLHMAREIAFYHHECWDGSGYPRGLSGEEIPLSARIVAVADVYEALSSRRVYKPPFPHEKCVEIIRNEAGRQLDPGLVEVFLKVESRFRDIARQYRADVPESFDRGQKEGIEPKVREIRELVSAGVRGDNRQESPTSLDTL